MISLHVYLTPLTGKFSDLEAAVSETWLPAMTKQPGFINAYLLQSFDDTELKKIGEDLFEYQFFVWKWSVHQNKFLLLMNLFFRNASMST